MKLLNVPIGLLINFHEMKLTDEVHRHFTGAGRGSRAGPNNLCFLRSLLLKMP
jgi:hypothetical protein